MLEVLVFSKRIIEKTGRGDSTGAPVTKKGTELYHSLSQREAAQVMPPPSLYGLQSLLWDKVGIIRNEETLNEAADVLAAWQNSLPAATERPSYELNNLALSGRLMTEAALLRKESRGAHFRSDFPEKSPEWKRHVVFTVR